MKTEMSLESCGQAVGFLTLGLFQKPSTSKTIITLWLVYLKHLWVKEDETRHLQCVDVDICLYTRDIILLQVTMRIFCWGDYASESFQKRQDCSSFAILDAVCGSYMFIQFEKLLIDPWVYTLSCKW